MEAQEKIRFLSLDEIKQLFEISTKDSPMFHAIIKMLYYTGMTVKELISLNVCDIDPLEEVIYIRKGETSGKERIVPIGSIVLRTLGYSFKKERLKKIRDKLFEVKTLFIIKESKILRELRAEEVLEKLKKYSKKAKIDPPVSTQIIRNTHAVHMIQKGWDWRVLKELLGIEDDQYIEKVVRAAKKSD